MPGIQLKSIKASDTASCICYVRKLGKIWSSRTIWGYLLHLPLKSKFTDLGKEGAVIIMNGIALCLFSVFTTVFLYVNKRK